MAAGEGKDEEMSTPASADPAPPKKDDVAADAEALPKVPGEAADAAKDKTAAVSPDEVAAGATSAAGATELTDTTAGGGADATAAEEKVRKEGDKVNGGEGGVGSVVGVGSDVSAGPPGKRMKRTDLADVLRVKKLSEKAVLPRRGSPAAAGYDLSSAEDAMVFARGKAIVKTDLSIAIPQGTYARIAPRSGLAAKFAIDVGAGVIDFDYRGNIGVILFNHSDKDFKINKGDRVAQLILERIVTPDVVEVDELDDTERGAGGFGSTGVAAGT